jgi:hypothetical protein
MVRDKISLAMSNLYFFNQSREMQIDFGTSFHLVPMLYFADVFFVRAIFAQYGK